MRFFKKWREPHGNFQTHFQRAWGLEKKKEKRLKPRNDLHETFKNGLRPSWELWNSRSICSMSLRRKKTKLETCFRLSRMTEDLVGTWKMSHDSKETSTWLYACKMLPKTISDLLENFMNDLRLSQDFYHARNLREKNNKRLETCPTVPKIFFLSGLRFRWHS